MRRGRCFTVALAGVLFASVSSADPPPVKVCVAVAGDPDESVRASAEALSEAVGRHAAVRGVADADARAALRGEPGTTPPDFVDLATARRALRGEDRDATTLDAVSTRLGCGLVVELMARPAGTAVRVYNPVTRAWPAARELATVDAAVVDSVIVPSLRAPAPTAATTATSRTSANTQRAVQPTPTRSVWSRAWPWVIVGGVALAVVGVYFLASDSGGATSTRITVVHAGAP